MKNNVHSPEQLAALHHLYEMWMSFTAFVKEHPSPFFNPVLQAMKRTLFLELFKYDKLLGTAVEHHGIGGEITAITAFSKRDVIVTFTGMLGTCLVPLKELNEVSEYAATYLEEN